ncbi:hypothetical protein ASF81_04435 [Brevundimonas sp. Leaf168]|nr:hypothetical protein ASF81_04435 [Brevundimonas sp. Leaf168]
MVTTVAVGDLDRAGQGLGIGLEQAVHLVGRLQIAIRMAFASKTQFVDGAAVPHAGDHVLQQALVRMMKEDVVGYDGRHAGLDGEGRQVVQPQGIAGASPQRQGEIGARGKGRLQPSQIGTAGLVRLVRNQDGDQALRPVFQVRPVEVAFRLAGAALAQREKARQPGIGRSIGRIDEHSGPIDQIKPAADDQPYAGGLGRLMGAHDPR